MKLKEILVSAAITGLVAIGTGLLVSYIQQREPKLVYSVEKSLPVLTDKNEWWSIQTITFQNIGTKEASSLVCEIDLPLSTEIKNVNREHDPTLPIKDSWETHSYRIEAKSLNPHEEIKITLLSSNKTGDIDTPDVYFRGEGVKGYEAIQANP